VRYDGAKWCKLLRPFASWVHWDSQAESLHGISQQMLQVRGEDPYKVCVELNNFLGNTIVYSDGWVVDNPWLIKLYAAANVDMSFTCRALEYILTEPQMERWHDVKSSLVAEHDVKRHRASSDAMIIQQTYAKTIELTQG